MGQVCPKASRDGRDRTCISASQTQRDAILLHPVEMFYRVAVSTENYALCCFLFYVIKAKTFTHHYRDGVLFIIIYMMEV